LFLLTDKAESVNVTVKTVHCDVLTSGYGPFFSGRARRKNLVQAPVMVVGFFCPQHSNFLKLELPVCSLSGGKFQDKRTIC
jgi:hypothetical protein